MQIFKLQDRIIEISKNGWIFVTHGQYPGMYLTHVRTGDKNIGTVLLAPWKTVGELNQQQNFGKSTDLMNIVTGSTYTSDNIGPQSLSTNSPNIVG